MFYSLAILAFWNPEVGSAQTRFLVPITPFLYFYLLESVRWIGKHAPLRAHVRLSPAGLAGVALIVLALAYRNLQDWRNPVRNRITDLSVGTTWIQKNTPLDSVVMVSDPVPAYLYARRKTVAFPGITQNIDQVISTYNITDIVVSPRLQTPRTLDLDESVSAQIVPFLQMNSDRFRPVFSDPEHNVTIYHVESKLLNSDPKTLKARSPPVTPCLTSPSASRT